jgi:hypothetical protein
MPQAPHCVYTPVLHVKLQLMVSAAASVSLLHRHRLHKGESCSSAAIKRGDILQQHRPIKAHLPKRKVRTQRIKLCTPHPLAACLRCIFNVQCVRLRAAPMPDDFLNFLLHAAVPRRSLLDVVVGHLKWLLLLVVSLLFVWIAQALLLLLGATIGCGSGTIIVHLP